MFHTSTSAFGRWQRTIWPVARAFVPRQTRWFIEGHPALDGQLWLADRRLLYETVRASRPAHAFEIGTWKGGGSTLFIAQALCDNGAGVLHTIEVDAGMVEQARRAYATRLPHLLPHLDFHQGDYRKEFADLLCPGLPASAACTTGEAATAWPRRSSREKDASEGGKAGTYDRLAVDLLFLDGAEDARETLEQYEFFMPCMRAGSVLLAHDWLTDKARLLRDRLEDPAEWRIDAVLLPPRSVGCARAIRL